MAAAFERRHDIARRGSAEERSFEFVQRNGLIIGNHLSVEWPDGRAVDDAVLDGQAPRRSITSGFNFGGYGLQTDSRNMPLRKFDLVHCRLWSACANAAP